jgi:acetylornithine deacetylase/succinyl-diaminopimelate desuccinylase-like protein
MKLRRLDPICAQRLRQFVAHLANDIGPRNIHHYEALRGAADYIEVSLAQFGYSPIGQTYEARDKTFYNIIAERRGDALAAEVIVVGAHYDSHRDSPGADDDASAVAALIELAGGWQPQADLAFCRLH